MCGIAGEYVFHGGQRVASQQVGRILSLLAHRGPDEAGYYVDDDQRVMLLNTRLAIVDLANGHQPLGNEDGSCWLTFNGEIYGYREIAQELRQRGHCLATASDSEVILHLYEDHGEAFVDHLRGEFALALFDQRRQALYLVRDRFGIKPLYYTVQNGSVIFGSEIKALLGHPAVQARLDDETVQSMLATIIPPGATLFAGIRQVEPGCFLKISRGQVRQSKYWRLPLADERWQGNGRHFDERQAIEEFRRLLAEAVRLRLQGDVEAGAYLSGGIDSAAVTALMARLAGRKVKAFTIGFDNPAYDESHPAAAVAAHTGLQQHQLQIGPDGLAEVFAESLWHTELPVMNAHGTAKFLLSQLAQRQVKVVLTGEGADELLLGYPQFRHQQLLEQQSSDGAAREELKAFLANEGIQFGVTTARHYEQVERIQRLFGTYPYPMLRALRFGWARQLAVAPDFRRRTRGRDPIVDLAQRLDLTELAGLPPLAATQYVLFKTDLANYILNVLGDRAEMAHSVEGRLPFLDHKLVEYVCQLPLAFKARDGCRKQMLREAVADLLPEGLRQRTKKQFMAPSPEVLGFQGGFDGAARGAGARALVEHFLSPQNIQTVGVFRPLALTAVRKLLAVLPRGSYLYGICEGILVFALSLHIIHEMFCQDFAASAERYASRRCPAEIFRAGGAAARGRGQHVGAPLRAVPVAPRRPA